MMQEGLFIDIASFQQKKHGQNAFGDSVVSQRFPEEGRLIAVLSDGLGSGIKANILSQMTATMILKFIKEGNDVLKSSELVMDSLPICKVRKISYATFSVIDCRDDGSAKIIEEGNPSFVWMRGGKVLEPQPEVITSKRFTSRHLHIYRIKLEENDRLIFMSDGVTQAGLGSQVYKLGWRREGLIEYLKAKLVSSPSMCSSQLSKDIVMEAERKEPDSFAKDDISSTVLYFRKPRKLLVFTGPPYRSDRDSEYARIFDSFAEKKIICGGTTANILSRELNRPIECQMNASPHLPSISHMAGVDLVTEGILTLTKAVEYLEKGELKEKDSAGMLVQMLQNSDCIKFMVGSRLNQAHNDPNLPVELEIRKNIIRRMVKSLEEKYIKKVELQFI